MNKILCFCGLLFWTGHVLTAQPLDTLLSLAARQNPELAALRQEYLAALERAPQVSQLPDPEVGLGVFALPVETRLGPQWVRLGATQAFPWMGVLAARKDVALAMARTEYERIGAIEVNLFYRVRQAYFQWYELRRSRAVIERNLELFASLERLALSRVEAGQATLADVLRVRLRQQELEKELEILENQARKPLAALNQVLNRAPATPVLIMDDLTVAELPFPGDSIFLEGHPELRVLAARQEVARQNLALNALEGKPSFAVGLDYIVVGERGDAAPAGNGRDIVSPRVGVKVPIYRKKYGAREEEEERRIAALEFRKEDTRNRFRAALDQASTDYRDAVLRLDLYEQQTRTIRSAIDILQEQYSGEGKGFDELLRLYVDLSNYERKKLQAVVQSHLAKAEIERYLLN